MNEFRVSFHCTNCLHNFNLQFVRGTVLTSFAWGWTDQTWKTHIGANGRFEKETVQCPNCGVDHVRKASI